MPELREDLVLAQEVITHKGNSTPPYVYALILLFLVIFSVGHVFFWHATLIDWDEGVFALQGEWFSSSGLFGKPYNFQTPPLFQLFIAVLFKLLGVHAFILHFISLASAGAKTFSVQILSYFLTADILLRHIEYSMNHLYRD